MTPTEHELTVAVDAAARSNFEIHERGRIHHSRWRRFDDLDPAEQLIHRQAVVRVIAAVLEVLPDRAEAERRRIGTYTLVGDGDGWCHHESCAVSIENGGHDYCTCGLEELLEQLRQVEPL